MSRRNQNDQEARQSLHRVWWPAAENCVVSDDSW